MKPPKLSKRLIAAVALLGDAARLADIGCDHGKLCVYALVQGIAQSAIAVDVSAPSLAKAERLAADYDVCLDARLGDGLTPIAPGEVDVAVIAGMGGMEIARILALASFAPPRLVLVPHKNADVVMRYLFLAGYAVDADYFVSDEGYWYRVIAAQSRAARPLGADWREKTVALDDRANWYVGESNAVNPEYAAYKRERLSKLRDVLAAGNRDAKVQAEINYLEQI